MIATDRRVVLVILDGWGVAGSGRSNAIALAKKPNFDRMTQEYPNTLLAASGAAVGLKEGEPGNSEAGHLNLGAGRLVLQEKIWISQKIHDGSFFDNETLISCLRRAESAKAKLHLVGLLSDGSSAHSEPDHLEALLVLCKKMRVPQVYLHLFTDGRDCAPKSAATFIQKLELLLDNLGVGRIASIAGRYYGMDRGGNWERTGLAYATMAAGQGPRAFTAYEAVQESYRRGVGDEFILPTVITGEDGTNIYTKNSGVKTVESGDSVIFFNLRSDRARQLVKAFVTPKECQNDKYDCKNFKKYSRLDVVTLSDFGTDIPAKAAFLMPHVVNCLPHYLGKYSGLRQLYVAEREKFAHVTYFFHGGRAEAERGESRIRVDSADVATFDRFPAMSAEAITDAVVQNMQKKIYNLSVVNYANADMLGHTGFIRPTVQAVEILDRELGRLAIAATLTGASLVITADHGNAEQMIDPISGKTETAHSTNPVPLIVIEKGLSKKPLRDGASLRDVAPTILELLRVPQPPEMTGVSLFTV